MGDLEDNLESLFLLEILVDNVQFDKPPKEEDLRETCVGFQFLKYPPLIICEEDFVYMADDEFDKQNVQFKSGKSLLFALPSLTDNDPNLGSVHVWVTRRVGRTEKTQVMGSMDINLSGSFENLLQASAKQQVTSPISKFIRDSYPFKADGQKVGTITAFLRISCFGKLIVTQFEVKGKEKFSFKGLDADKTVDVDPQGVRFSPGTKEGTKDRAQSPGQEFSQGPIGGAGGAYGGMYPGQGGMGMGPGGMGPGGMGMGPGMGMGGMGPGGMGMGGMGPGGMGMGGMGPGGMGMGGMGGPYGGMFPGQGGMGPGYMSGMMGPGGQIMGPCPGPKPWLHGKKGTLPCGEPVCPAGNCGHFPCSHASTCNLGACAGMCAGMYGGPAQGPMGPGSKVSPEDRTMQVTEEEIAAATKSSQEKSADAQPKAGKAGKGKGKGKK